MRPVRVAYIEEAKNGNLGCATLRRRDILNAVHNYKIIPIRRYEKKIVGKVATLSGHLDDDVSANFAAQERSEMIN